MSCSLFIIYTVGNRGNHCFLIKYNNPKLCACASELTQQKIQDYEILFRQTGKAIQELNRDIRFAAAQISAVSEHAHETGHYPLWNDVTVIDRDSHCFTRRDKEAILIRLHPKTSGIE